VDAAMLLNWAFERRLAALLLVLTGGTCTGLDGCLTF